MNHQERVMTGVNHVEPDRLPVDLGGMHSSGIMAMDYQELKEHLGISEGELLIPDAPQQLAYVEAPVRERFGVDVLPLDIGMVVGSRPYVLPNGVRARISASFLTEDDGSGGEFVVDAGGTRLKHRPASSFYFYPIYHPLQEAQTAADIDAYEWPILTDEELELLRREARRLRENEGRDYAVIGVLNAALLEIAQDVRGWDTFMMDIVGEPELAERLLDNMLESCFTNIDRYFGAVGEYIDIIQVGGDGGTETQRILPFGTPEEVYANTAELIEIFKPGGGFVFCQVHNIQAMVPPQNVVAMYQAVHDHWQY